MDVHSNTFGHVFVFVSGPRFLVSSCTCIVVFVCRGPSGVTVGVPALWKRVQWARAAVTAAASGVIAIIWYCARAEVAERTRLAVRTLLANLCCRLPIVG